MTATNNDFRRRDLNTAEKVQRGITLLHISGRHKALRYLINCGIDSTIIERVLGFPMQRRQFGKHSIADRRA